MENISSHRGASALVLSGELTEGVSDLSGARTAPGGVPALREVNQDRSHPDAPDIEEQPFADFRQLAGPGGRQPGAVAWTTVSPGARGAPSRPPGPATKVAAIARHKAHHPFQGESHAAGPPAR